MFDLQGYLLQFSVKAQRERDLRMWILQGINGSAIFERLGAALSQSSLPALVVNPATAPHRILYALVRLLGPFSFDSIH
jgi:hypothetical protein